MFWWVPVLVGSCHPLGHFKWVTGVSEGASRQAAAWRGSSSSITLGSVGIVVGPVVGLDLNWPGALEGTVLPARRPNCSTLEGGPGGGGRDSRDWVAMGGSEWGGRLLHQFSPQAK